MTINSADELEAEVAKYLGVKSDKIDANRNASLGLYHLAVESSRPGAGRNRVKQNLVDEFEDQLESGFTISVEVHDGRINRGSDIEQGMIAWDREGGTWVIVTTDPYGSADSVSAGNQKICEYSTNADYPDDDPVVDCLLGPTVDREELQRDRATFYTYPVSRLEKAIIKKPSGSIPQGYGPHMDDEDDEDDDDTTLENAEEVTMKVKGGDTPSEIGEEATFEVDEFKYTEGKNEIHGPQVEQLALDILDCPPDGIHVSVDNGDIEIQVTRVSLTYGAFTVEEFHRELREKLPDELNTDVELLEAPV